MRQQPAANLLNEPLSFKCALVLVDNGSAHRSKAINDALVERVARRFRLKFRAIGQSESGGIVERTLQTIEKKASEFVGKPTLADVKKIIAEVCQTFNHTVHSILKTTPAVALAVSRSGSKNRPAVGRKLDPLPLEDRETFLLDLLRVIKTPQVRRSCIVFENLTYRHPELADLHGKKVSVKVSPDRWRHFVHAYHPQKKEYLKVPLDYNATFAFTEAEVSEAVKAANLRGKSFPIERSWTS